MPETVVEGGIEAAPRAFVEMLRGEHLGKVVVALRNVNGGWVRERGSSHCGMACVQNFTTVVSFCTHRPLRTRCVQKPSI